MSIKMFNIVALSDDAVVINGAGGSSGPTAKAGRNKKRSKRRKPKSVAKSVASEEGKESP
jgi:hypothetical protein